MKTRVLVAVLDWGLGHATRCIPIINELLNVGCEVIIAGSGNSLQLLKKEYPMLLTQDLPAYDPRYSVRGFWMSCKMLVQLPRFFRVISQERMAISRIVDACQIDVIISDNRYGCFDSRVPSIFVTHQTHILVPRHLRWVGTVINKISHRYIRKFSQCWIPDDAGGSVAGELILSNRLPKGVGIEYIGRLSRFRPSGTTSIKFDVLALLSGPEPQRSVLEKMIVPQLEKSMYSFFVVRGLPFEEKSYKANIVPYLTTEELRSKIESSAVVIARSGYSTVMDLLALGKRAILIPTPGQTEQEYLARSLMEKGVFYSVPQHAFNLEEAMDGLNRTGCKPPPEKSGELEMLLTAAIRKLLPEFRS